MLELLSIFDKPSMLHAAVVHLPIALVVFGVPMLLLTALFHRNTALRLVTLLIFVVAAATAWMAEETGEGANRNVPLDIPAAVSAIRDEHMDLGEKIPAAAGVTALLVFLSLIPNKESRTGFTLLALVSAIMTAGLTAYTAHLGGALVYEHGIGTPNAAAHAAAPAETATETPPPPPDLVAIRPIDMAEAKTVSYTRDIAPIMEDFCIDCHEAPDSDGNFDVTTVANLLKAGDKAGPGVIPGDPDKSAIVRYIRGELQPRMPKKKKPLSEDNLHLIRLWIAAGAIDDSEAATAAPAESTPAEPAAMPNTGELTTAQ